jgi:hypothetical protein
VRADVLHRAMFACRTDKVDPAMTAPTQYLKEGTVRLTRCLALALMTFACIGTARARDKAECASAYEDAQVLRQEHKLIEAQTHLYTCSHSSCPTAVARDCRTWLDELQKALPSVVLTAQAEDGRDLVSATIFLDGTPLDEASIGKALNVNPGPHTVRVVAEGFEPREQDLVAREGEQSRLVSVVMHPLSSAQPQKQGGNSLVTGSVSEAAPKTRRLGWPFYTLGGLALASGGAGIGLGLSGKHDRDHMKSACSPTCKESEVSAARVKLIAANTAFALAGASAVAALVVALVQRPKQDEVQVTSKRPALRLRASLDITSAGGMAVLGGSY